MGLISEIGHGLNAIFGNDPGQYVEPDDMESLKNVAAIAVRKGLLSKEEAVALMKSFKSSIIEGAKNFARKIEESIGLTPSERMDGKKQPVNVEIQHRPERPERSERIRE